MSAPRASAPIEPSELAGLVSGYASDVKAQDIVELDLRGVLGYTDYFVIASGGTDRQTKAIHDRIHENMKKEHGLLPRRVEGLGEARWILMDYLDVIVHVFTPDAREYYRLEQLWGEAPKRVVDGLRLAVGVTGRDHEVVGVAEHAAQIELDDVLRLDVRRVARDELGELGRLHRLCRGARRAHAYSPSDEMYDATASGTR